MLSLLRSFIKHPATHALVGFAMMGTALFEVVSQFLETAELSAGSAHGVALFGLIQGMKALSELFEGAELVDSARD